MSLGFERCRQCPSPMACRDKNTCDRDPLANAFDIIKRPPPRQPVVEHVRPIEVMDMVYRMEVEVENISRWIVRLPRDDQMRGTLARALNELRQTITTLRSAG